MPVENSHSVRYLVGDILALETELWFIPASLCIEEALLCRPYKTTVLQ